MTEEAIQTTIWNINKLVKGICMTLEKTLSLNANKTKYTKYNEKGIKDR